MKKMSKNDRFVATIKGINYSAFKSEGITVCNLTVQMRYRNNIITEFHITNIARSVEKVKDYDIEFGKKLARAKVELNMYENVKEKVAKLIFNKATIKDFNNDTAIKDVIIMMNTIQFCNKMIKHQTTYINKLIRNKFPNE